MADYGWTIGPDTEGFFWQSCRDGSVGGDAIRGGVENDGSPLYVGRAIHEGDLLPAKISTQHGCAFVCWGGKEHQKYDYDVLCSTQSVVWQTSSGGRVPDGAFPAGKTSDGEPLFVGRVFHDGGMTIGKVHPGHSHCYIPYAGEELAFKDYEVMVLKPLLLEVWPQRYVGYECGVEKNGQPLYVGRARHNGDLLPAKISPQHGCAYVSWNGQEHKKSDYEVLCGSRDVVWKSASGGRVPDRAEAAGQTTNGERLFVGRVLHDGGMTLGKIHPSHGHCYVPYGGKELSFRDYEVMVLT